MESFESGESVELMRAEDEADTWKIGFKCHDPGTDPPEIAPSQLDFSKLEDEQNEPVLIQSPSSDYSNYTSREKGC